MKLTKDYKEFLELLNEKKVKYLLVGGYALAIHGRPRFTGDIDIWIKNDLANSGKIIEVLNDFGFSSLNLTPGDFQEDGIVIQLGYAPNRVDLMTSLTAIAFDDCYGKRVEGELDGIPVNVLDLESLRKNKAALNRNIDIDDLRKL